MTQSTKTVVLVHGFLGFHGDTFNAATFMLDSYWDPDMEKYFERNRWRVLKAHVGPVSSNWDRACELYAQLIGSDKVDYGASHSTINEHDRFVKNTHELSTSTITWDKENPIHFIGHSMGGTTIRMLQHLMVEGDKSEKAWHQKNGGAMSKLFEGGHHGYFKSITCIASPLNGTTLTEITPSIVHQLALGVVTRFDDVLLYDFKMNQFDDDNPPEKDHAPYDLSVDGTEKLNHWMKQSYDDTFYFSIVARSTQSILGITVPNFSFSSPLLKLTAAFMGTRGRTSEWRDNDGVVPTYSQAYPRKKFGNQNRVYEIDRHSTYEKGIWYSKGYKADHLQIIGLAYRFLSNEQEFQDMYQEIEGILSNLPDNNRDGDTSLRHSTHLTSSL